MYTQTHTHEILLHSPLYRHVLQDEGKMEREEKKHQKQQEKIVETSDISCIVKEMWFSFFLLIASMTKREEKTFDMLKIKRCRS